MEEIIRANVRMWSDKISFKDIDAGTIENPETIYDIGDNILKKNGEITKLIAHKNYISTKDTKVYNEDEAIVWVGNKIKELQRSPFHEFITSGEVQATLWLAIFEPSKFLHDKRLAELSQTAKAANLELFLEDYTDLSDGGNPRKYHFGATRR